MKKKFFGLFALGLLSMGVLAACGNDNNAAADAQETESTFTMGISGSPNATNPIVSSDRFGLTVVNMIYSPLARLNADNEVEFDLAQSYEVSEDGLTITVDLRDDVLWSDGEKFTSADVVFTYEIMADRDNGNYSDMWVDDEVITVEANGDYQVIFTLPTVSVAAINNVLLINYIIPEHVFANEPDFSANDLVASPVGTGPYVLVNNVAGEYLQFEANEHYFRGRPNIDNITLRIIENADTQRAALQSGQIDAVVIFPADIPDFDENQIDIFAFSENRVGYLGMNVATDELSDVRVRQAIRYALNTNDMNIAAYLDEDFFNTPVTFLPPNNPFATTDVNLFEEDLDRARELLAEAGVENLTINLGFSSSDPAQTIQATLIQEQLAQVGITVELDGGDSSAMFVHLREPGNTQYNMWLGGYIMGMDPDSYSVLFHSAAGSNFWNYASDEADELFNLGAVELDEARRMELYAQLQDVINNDSIIQPIVDNLRILAVNNRIGGVEEAGLVPIYTFQDMSKLYIR